MHLSLALYKGMTKNNHAKTLKDRTKCHRNGDKISHHVNFLTPRTNFKKNAPFPACSRRVPGGLNSGKANNKCINQT